VLAAGSTVNSSLQLQPKTITGQDSDEPGRATVRPSLADSEYLSAAEQWLVLQCSETGQLFSLGLFLSRAAVIAASKPCRAAKLGIRQIQVDVRTADVMARAGGAAGPAPDVRHQPEGNSSPEYDD
jgi:hypothetical protein